MRASPAFQVNLQHFAVCRTGVGTLTVVASLCTLAWCASGSEPKTAMTWLLAVTVNAVLVCLGVAATHSEHMSLRWDTETWRLGPAASIGEEPWSGQLAVLIDLGPWMLLSFRLQEQSPKLGFVRPMRWLAVQRGGLSESWHGFRCAVYSTRPAGLGPTTDPLLPTE